MYRGALLPQRLIAVAVICAPVNAVLPAFLVAPIAPDTVILPAPALILRPLAFAINTVFAADTVKFLVPQASSVFAESRVELKVIV